MCDRFLPVKDLNIGSIDAINYTSRQDKEFLSRVFLRDSFFEKILEHKRYFLVGEKGTGKTAYATLLSNTNYKNTLSTIVSMTSTDYSKFIKLKALGNLNLSDYNDTRRVILLLLMAQHIKNKNNGGFFQQGKFSAIQNSIDQYYHNAFTPEFVNAIEFVEHAEVRAELVAKALKIGGSRLSEATEKGAGFQTSLLFLEKSFKDAISSLKLTKDHILFIDGIDVRPSDIQFDTYVECIRGLASAVWALNLDFFSNIRDSKGRIKVVLLLRPDILNSIRFQNTNAKVRDNSIVLDWRTTYQDYRGSRIFKLIDGILAKQKSPHEDLEVGQAWDYYFPYNLPNMRIAEKTDNPFIGFLRYSFYRPRDIISYIDIMKEYVAQYHEDFLVFNDDVFLRCQSDYSEYLLAEIKDNLAFYYADADFDELIGFFVFLTGDMRFSWEKFNSAYTKYRASNQHKSLNIKDITDGPEAFIQFLYSLNVIGYNELSSTGDNFVHWSFRDRTATVLNPKIPLGIGNTGDKSYSVHPGLARALKLGRVSG